MGPGDRGMIPNDGLRVLQNQIYSNCRNSDGSNRLGEVPLGNMATVVCVPFKGFVCWWVVLISQKTKVYINLATDNTQT